VPVNGIAVTSVAAGSILVWSGIKGWNVTRTVGEIISGQTPKGSNVNPLTNSDSFSGGGGVINSPSDIANDAQKYNGHAYSYGGAPGKDGKSPWDCSSFVNWVIGHDFNHSIPGAANFDGSSHGPPTGLWMAWPGMKHVSQQIQAGDIIVWATHMGIAISSTQMISALNSQLGTRVTEIHGTARGPMIVGRLK
jgi:cell wall-associated NlpC family hydrolase